MQRVKNEELGVSITMKRNTETEKTEKENKLTKQEVYLLEFRKKKYGIQKDLLTGEEFIPKKSNQKFVSNKNRTHYYNNLNNQKVQTLMKQMSVEEQFTLWGDIVDLIKWNEKNLNRDGLIESLKEKYKVSLIK